MVFGGVMMSSMIELIEQSWAKGRLPIIQGIVKKDGLYYEIKYEENQMKTANPIPFLFDFTGDDFSEIDSFFKTTINNYTLYCGEGSWGGDGFIYIEDTKTKQLLWCLFDDRINPITKCTISKDKLIAENNNSIQYIFDFQNPEKL